LVRRALTARLGTLGQPVATLACYARARGRSISNESPKS
jgi:hypothetical protein